MDKFVDKVKDGFTKAVDGAGKYSKKAVKKASGIIDKTKYSYAINSAEEKKLAVMAELGEYIYEGYCTDSTELPEEIIAKCKEIDELKEEIEALKGKVAELKDSVVCSKCGEYIPNGNTFCGKCGEKLD